MTAAWLARILPTPASADAGAFDAMLASVHLHAGLVLASWLVVFLYMLVRFRASRQVAGRAPGPPAGGRWPLVAVAAVVIGDVWLLAGSALPVWWARAQPPPAGAVEVRVIGEQFAWNVHYPGLDGRFGRIAPSLITAADPIGIDRADPDGRDDFVLINLLVVPVNRTVVAHLSSKDVIHSFTLPEMRVKQDVSPGQASLSWFTPVTTGTWEVGCSQLCGLGHYRMRGIFEVRSEAEWHAFVADEVSRVIEP